MKERIKQIGRKNIKEIKLHMGTEKNDDVKIFL